MTSLSKTARNEQKKLSATYLNNLGVGVFAVGTFTPVASFVVQPSLDWSGAASMPVRTAVFSLCCLGGSMALHLFGRLFLRGCEE